VIEERTSGHEEDAFRGREDRTPDGKNDFLDEFWRKFVVNHGVCVDFGARITDNHENQLLYMHAG